MQINKKNLFKLILYCCSFCYSCCFIAFLLLMLFHLVLYLLCDLYIFFIYVLLDILYLTDTAKLPFIMGLIFYICLSFDIFHLAVIFVFLCRINICIVKQTYINFSVCSLHTCKLIISLWDCVCISVHSSVNMFFLFLSPFLFIDYL